MSKTPIYIICIILFSLLCNNTSYAQPAAKPFSVTINDVANPTFPDPAMFDDSIIVCLHDTLDYKIIGYSPSNYCSTVKVAKEAYIIKKYLANDATGTIIRSETRGMIGTQLQSCNQGLMLRDTISTLGTFYIYTNIVINRFDDPDHPVARNHVTKVIVSTVPNPPTMFTVTPSPTTAPGGKATIQVNNPDPNIDYVWYRSKSITSRLTDKNINTNPFTTGELSSDTNFYVVAQEKPNINLGARCGSNYVAVPVKVQGQFFIPNVFAPNGSDPANRKFQVRLIYANAEMVIYNQWGQKIFQTKDPVVGWDGNVNGKPQPTGVYVYVITGTTINGKPFIYKGSVTLVR